MSSSSFAFISLFSLLIISLALAQPSFRPKSLIFAVKKDPSTLQYITHINQRTPLISVGLTLDLGGQHLWMDCEQGYVSTTFHWAHCPSAQCSLFGSYVCTICFPSSAPNCRINMCQTIVENTVTESAISGVDAAYDIVSIRSAGENSKGHYSLVPQFLFLCGTKDLVQGLASGSQGMAGLGRTRVSLPSQFSAAFSFPRKFTLCLTSTNSNGFVFFGKEPHVLTTLTYTPLILNPVSTALMYIRGDASSDYFIGVKSMKINGKMVPINKTMLSIDSKGYGGTKISTVNPYTVLETSIYNAVTDVFVKELANVTRVASVSPFGACFNSKQLTKTRFGLGVPSIDLVLHSEKVYWRIWGANSMVQVSDEVACLGFVDGGVRPRTSLIIGGHQIEDTLLEFDLAASRLGFSSTLLSRQTNCANFKFTSNA